VHIPSPVARSCSYGVPQLDLVKSGLVLGLRYKVDPGQAIEHSNISLHLHGLHVDHVIMRISRSDAPANTPCPEDHANQAVITCQAASDHALHPE
jgi:hypothetical protein